MNRWTFALCMPLSLVALGIAFFALSQGGPVAQAPSRDVQFETSLRESLASLETRVVALEKSRQRSSLRHRVEDARKQRSSSDEDDAGEKTRAARGDDGPLDEQILALTERLALLEDDATIARLAKTGERRVALENIRNSIATVGNPDAAPEERIEAMGDLRGQFKKRGPWIVEAMEELGMEEADLVLPMLELAQDAGLETDLRSEAIESVVGSKTEEIRGPLLRLLANDLEPQIREVSMQALLWHLEDDEVRQAIVQTAENDGDAAVRARATRFLPKVEHVERELAEEAAEAHGSSDEGEGAGK